MPTFRQALVAAALLLAAPAFATSAPPPEEFGALFHERLVNSMSPDCMQAHQDLADAIDAMATAWLAANEQALAKWNARGAMLPADRKQALREQLTRFAREQRAELGAAEQAGTGRQYCLQFIHTYQTMAPLPAPPAG